MRGLPRLLLTALAVAGGPAQAAVPLELAVKATYLYKLASYVAWPPSAFSSSAMLNLCVVGHDPFGRVLDEAVAGAQVDGRPVAVRRLPVIDRVSGCHVAYLGGSSRQSPGEALRALQGGAVLTITDAERDSRAHGIVHFEVRAKRVRFHIDDRSAAAGQLGISSKLLDLALTVRPRGR